MPEYVNAFKAAFPKDNDPVTFQNMATAIGAFERKLITPSRWDKFLQGDQTASRSREAGSHAFITACCQTATPARCWGDDVPKARRDQTLSGSGGSGPVPTHQE
jgi:cytochrome c peroxidase